VKILFTEHAWEDYLYWEQTDRAQLKRVNELIRDILRQPFEGIWKPEPLRYEFKGYWSRRIDSTRRLVYKVADGALWVVQCRYHY
jgi:toxin YoeB